MSKQPARAVRAARENARTAQPFSRHLRERGTVNSKLNRRGWLGGLAALGLALAAGSGCQTYVPSTGLTLPTGWYLQHLPQYFPPSPPFPLPRELATQQTIAAQPAPGGPEGLPPPLPGAG